MGKTVLKKINAFFVVLAFLLQAASIGAPGWLIIIQGNVETEVSLFYEKRCHVIADESHCVTKTSRTIFGMEISKLRERRVSQNRITEADFKYHMLVCKQVLTIFAAFLTLLCVIVQLASYIRRRMHNVKLTILSSVMAAVSAGVVLAVVSFEIVTNYYQDRLLSNDGLRDHSYIGFPYCLGMLTGSALMLLMSCVCTAFLLYTPKVVIKKKVYDDEPLPVKVSDSAVSAPFSTEIALTTVPANSNSVDKKANKAGQDNPVFSEKL